MVDYIEELEVEYIRLKAAFFPGVVVSNNDKIALKTCAMVNVSRRF